MLFYEVKANLTRAQLQLLARAGVRHIQPGLDGESLSSHVLRLMRKGRAGRTARQRTAVVSLLWHLSSLEHAVGFPGETADDYMAQTAAMPHLQHLQPLAGATRVWLERFSPLFTESDAFGVRGRMPERSYRYVYPAGVNLERAAYFFDYELDTGVPAEIYRAFVQMTDQWSQVWRGTKPPVLTYRSAPGLLQIHDGRQPGHEGTYAFEGTLADVYLACCDRQVTAAGIRERLALDLPDEAVQEILIEFQRRGLVFLDGNLAVALALPALTGH